MRWEIVHHLATADRVIDCKGKQYVIPGMIDIHVHGAAGFDFMDGKQEAFEGIALALAKEGTTSFLATTITNPVSYTSDTLKSLGRYRARQQWSRNRGNDRHSFRRTFY